MKDILAFWRGPIRGSAWRARVHTRGQPVDIPSALSLVAAQGGKKSSLLGTALATTNNTALQPQGIGPDNPRVDTKLMH